jgi:hypothetical protein
MPKTSRCEMHILQKVAIFSRLSLLTSKKNKILDIFARKFLQKLFSGQKITIFCNFPNLANNCQTHPCKAVKTFVKKFLADAIFRKKMLFLFKKFSLMIAPPWPHAPPPAGG